MTRTKRALFITVFVVVAALVAGAANAPAKPKATPTVTLSFLQTTAGQIATQILIANFERVYPNIKVNAQYLPTSDLGTVLLTQLQAGNAPDIFFTQLGNTSPWGVWSLAAGGRALDLSGRKWQNRIVEKPLASWKGKIYAWPGVVVPYDVLYNVDLFKQLGLKVPTQFSELLALCRRITAAGKVPFTQSFSTSVGGLIVGRVLYSQFVYGVDPNWDEKRVKKQVTFAGSPLWHRALQAFVDMKDAGCFQPGSQATSRPQQYAMFGRGDALMAIVPGTDLANVLAVNPNLNYGMFNLPADNPKNARVFSSGALLFAGNAATHYPAQVKTFIDFMAREQQSTLYAKVSGAIAPLDAKKGKLPSYMKALVPFYKNGKTVATNDGAWPNTRIFGDGYSAGIIGLITGQTTIDGILAEMDRLWETG